MTGVVPTRPRRVHARGFFHPDLPGLHRLASEAIVLRAEGAGELLARPSGMLPLADIASLFKSLLALPHEMGRLIRERSSQLRKELFGDYVVPMAPVEIANTCLSDCVFCGWRASNPAMKRMRIPLDLAMMQVEYLIDLGIPYIEFVSGDDLDAVRSVLPELIKQTREMFEKRGIPGKIAFCTLALTERQYAALRECGADAMILWQETYDEGVFRKCVLAGPKAFGVTEEWRVPSSGNGCRFRAESQERAMRAGLEVALGSMLGLNPEICVEFLATVEHARYLAAQYGATPDHPITIGMPVWNPITTQATDLRPQQLADFEELFSALAGLYLISLPMNGVWVFPNCRVGMKAQIDAVRVAGAFSSTEVKLGPGGYLPAVVRKIEGAGVAADALRGRIGALVRDAEGQLDELAKALDAREQFVHHYHEHEVYRREMENVGLKLSAACRIPV